MAGEVTSLSSTWSATGKFTGDPYLMSLRGKDPKRTSTVTMHVAKHRAQGSNTSAGVRSHHFGPGVKVIGGQLQYAYEERGSSIKVGKSPDAAEILRDYLRPPRPTTAPPEDATTSSYPAAARPSTSYDPHTHARAPPQAAAEKVVYWDGTQHHIINKPAEHAGLGGTGRQGESDRAAWRPPHLEHKDVEPGPLLGVRETGGAAGVSLIGSKYRLMPEQSPAPGKSTWTGTNMIRTGPTFPGPIPPPYGANKGPYGLKPYAPINATTSFGSAGNINEATLREYAAFKMVGHKEYERTCKSLEGIQAWNAAEADLTSSMSHGHSTRLLAPREHVVSKLSLRRGGF